jgi:hypothetical protein
VPDLEYYVKKLDIEAIANREEAMLQLLETKN